MLGLFELLSKFIIAEKVTAVEVIEPAACIISIIEQKPAYNFETDNSLWKYVSPDSSLLNVEYVPPGLVDIEKVSELIDVHNNQGQLRSEAASALADLAVAFNKQFSKPLVVVSSYRGYAYQKKLLSGYIAKYGESRAHGFSAKPGHSEHQLGLAVDVFNASTDGADGYKNYFAWMRENAYKYGWTQSYQKGPDIDGYVIEPWHWRFVGKDLALYLWENHMTFSEYVTFWRVWKK